MSIFRPRGKAGCCPWLGLLCLAALCCGCGPTKMPLAQVRGKVTLDGKPLTNGTIIFTPSEEGQQAKGLIGPDGTFVLGTLTDNDGAYTGKHQVSFFVSNQGAFEAPPSAKPLVSPIPAKYYAPTTSGLSFVVEAGKINEANFDLKSR